MVQLYPEIEPYASGRLDVGDNNAVYWETCGNPDGVDALVVHGGPGSGCSAGARRWFDPARYRVVLVDQRNCGRSRPHASDPSVDLASNTTANLIEDFEKIRVHLGIERWIVRGWSWGSTLALAYAEQHPDRASAIVLSAVTTTRRSEIDWLYRGVGRFFPEAWERFRAAADVAADGDVVARYAELVESSDPRLREMAVREWCAWEDAVLSLETDGSSNPYGDRMGAAKVAFVRICARYFSHGAWLDEGALIEHADVLNGIPGVLVHGRSDLGGPPHTAWQLAQRWRSAELHVVDAAGHLGNSRMDELVLNALNRFAATS
jgi:proline iminopeptidase